MNQRLQNSELRKLQTTLQGKNARAIMGITNEATNGANADPLELLAKLDDPAREGELKDGIKKFLRTNCTQ